MNNFRDLDQFIAEIQDMDTIPKEVKTEWLKNVALDYLWPIVDYKYIIPQAITPEDKIIIQYKTLIFSEKQKSNFKRYNILITQDKIEIDCINKYLAVGLDELKNRILKLKEILI